MRLCVRRAAPAARAAGRQFGRQTPLRGPAALVDPELCIRERRTWRGQRRTAKANRRGQNAAKAARATAKPIELYYWPTPNGWKISIMLEECGLPYTMIPVNISQGRAVQAGLPARSRRTTACRRSSIRDGPGGRPISIFESGAILQYLGRKTGKFYPRDERARVEVDQWLFWQMGGLGPMAGQAHHFRNYAPETLTYAINRYTNEVNRLYGVMNKRLPTANSSPATIRSPTWPASAGPMAGSARARTSTQFPQSEALARDA